MNPNEAIIVWGDVGGCVNVLFFSSAQISLFERPPAPAGEKQGKVDRQGYRQHGYLMIIMLNAKDFDIFLTSVDAT